MSARATDSALPRADAPDTPPDTKGFFAFGDTHLRGLGVAFWLLCLYFFVAIAALDEEWPAIARFRPRLLLGAIVLLVAGVQVVRAAFTNRRGPTPPDAVSLWWGAYVLATLFATIWAFDFALAKDTLLDHRLPALLCFLLIVVIVRTRRELLVLVLVFCLAFGFYLLRSFQEYHAGRYVAAMGVKRMVGAGTQNADPNSFAATIMFSLPLLLWAGVHARSLVLRLCVSAYGVLAVLAVVLTRSRSGLILLALTAVWTLFLLPRGRARRWGLVLLLLAGFAASTQLSESAIERYKGILSGGSTQSEKESTEGRIRGYQVAWQIFREHPFLGVGPGNWSTYRMRKVDGDRLMPHNLGGQLIATLGLLGTIAFVGYLLAVFRRGLAERAARKDAADPWDRAVRSLVGAMLFTVLLLLVSGIAAHNLGRWVWCWAPAVLLVAATCRRAPEGEGVSP